MEENSNWYANRTQDRLAYNCPNIPWHNAIKYDGLTLNSRDAK